ncbi:hypothetical protein F511_29751 [Dorcoceras hygrometricum]|uniref:Uncharacterized protein n=1 Tax=Dorcoceras hygrometricum TaxID=472368 RepID=A0A2Z7BWW7_9LAMI|nr:hypothetical protein F511_29751 [Dorcoceras hygrometricum]
MLNTLSSVSVRESRIQYLCDPQWFRDTASRGPTTIVAPESQFRLDHRIMYGPFNPYIPIRSTIIGKSRVAKDPIAMRTSWRSNSDIASVTSIGYPRMSASGESSTTMHRLLHASGSHTIPPPNDPKTTQYNQDLGLIHSTNGNHLEVRTRVFDRSPDSPRTSASKDQATRGVCFPGYSDGTEQLIESTRLRYTGELNRTCTVSLCALKTKHDQGRANN